MELWVFWNFKEELQHDIINCHPKILLISLVCDIHVSYSYWSVLTSSIDCSASLQTTKVILNLNYLFQTYQGT